MELFYTYLQSPLGRLEICGTDTHVTSINFKEEGGRESENLPRHLKNCSTQLSEYFDGKRRSFDVKLEPDGTVFQQMVWSELQKINFGDTLSYGDIARKLNDDKLTRAVGNANGKNPIAVIIPCHRVIGENGSLTGYAGGMWRKKWLLEMEGRVSGKNLTLF